MSGVADDIQWLTDNTLNWSLEVDPEKACYESREDYLAHREDLDDVLVEQPEVLTAEHMFAVQVYPYTPIGFYVVYGTTAEEALRLACEDPDAPLGPIDKGLEEELRQAVVKSMDTMTAAQKLNFWATLNHIHGGGAQ